MASFPSDWTTRLDLDARTAAALMRFMRRRRSLLLCRAIAAGVLFGMTAMIVIAIIDFLWLLPDPVRWGFSLVGYAIAAFAMWRSGLREFAQADPREVARQMESADPRLREELLSAVELSDPVAANGSPAFRHQLQRHVARRVGLLDVKRLLPWERIQRWLLACLVLVTVCTALLFIPTVQFGRRVARAMLPGVPIERASLTQVEILEPSPASGFAAEGDAVAVAVRVWPEIGAAPTLQWRTDSDLAGYSTMTPRSKSDAASERVSSGATSSAAVGDAQIFAANLSVGTEPMEYRVRAGDAITLWHRLVPLPRPRVHSFEKVYRFPDYAELEPRRENSEHGDLKALSGTNADLTVQFDQPVLDPVVRFSNRGANFEMESVDSSRKRFHATIPIRAPAHYQIDATSVESGLNNPFGPQYSITPVLDQPPQVSWDDSLPVAWIVSPLDVLALSATVTDDLPLERVVHEFQVNEQPVQRRQVAIDQPAREHRLHWEWDLLHRESEQEESPRLAGGDMIRMRLVAVDRDGKRGQSQFIDVLIAEEGFDADRHERFLRFSDLVADLTKWSVAAENMMQELRQAAKDGETEPVEGAAERIEKTLQEQQAIQSSWLQFLTSAESLREGRRLEMLARSMIDLHQKLRQLSEDTEAITEDAADEIQAETLKSIEKTAERIGNDFSRLTRSAQTLVAEALTVALVDDGRALRRSLEPMLRTDDPLPEKHFPRHFNVVLGRLRAMNELIQQHQGVLPDSTLRHLENWLRFSSDWIVRLASVIERPQPVEANRILADQLASELTSRLDGSMLDGRLPSTLSSTFRDLRFQYDGIGSQIHALKQTGTAAEGLRQRIDATTDSGELSELNPALSAAEGVFRSEREQLLARIASEESTHRARPRLDLHYAADLNRIGKAMGNVTRDGFQPYEDESPGEVLRTLARAFQVIEATHEIGQWHDELQRLMLAERELVENATSKFVHANQIEQFPRGMEWPIQTLRNVGDMPEVVKALQQLQQGEDYRRAREITDARRYSGEPMRSAEFPLQSLVADLDSVLESLQPHLLAARDAVARYLLELSEQARQAAELAAEAERQTAARETSDPVMADELSPVQQRAEEAANRTIESLTDLANTIDPQDPQQRELATDADVAATQIRDAVSQASEARQQAARAADDEGRSRALDDVAEAMQSLQKSLERTADHFARAEQGESLAESRQQLRDALTEDPAAMPAQDPQSDSLADSARRSPEELLEELERELQQNEPMQQELSDISEQAATLAQRALAHAAEEERSLQHSIERTDEAFAERKRRLAQQLSSLADETKAVDESMLNAAERALGWAGDSSWESELKQARASAQQLKELSDAEVKENAPLQQLQQAAQKMRQQLQSIRNDVAESRQLAEDSQDVQVHTNDSARERAQEELERYQRESRSQNLRKATDAKEQWSRYRKLAGTRIGQARREKRNAEDHRRRIEQNLERESSDKSRLQQQLQQAEQRISEAERREQAVQASLDLAEQEIKAAEDRAERLRNQRLESLEKKNPAAEMAQRVTRQAEETLSRLDEQLATLAEQAEFGEDLRLDPIRAEQFQQRQQRIATEVAQAGEQLRRAARHESRLGQSELSDQLQQSADQVDQRAVEAARRAEEALQQANANGQQTPAANQAIAHASQEISAAAEQLAGLLAGNQPDASEDSDDPASDASQAEQLARTLDELDRALHPSASTASPSPPSESSSPQSSSAEASSQPSDSQQSSADSADGSSGESKQQATAGEASPTLANSLQSQARQAARQRQHQMQPGQSEKKGDAASPNQTASEASSSQSGAGEGNQSGVLENMDVDRRGSEKWGQLRERRSDETSESRGPNISPEFRREIEAYFRAVARQAAANAKASDGPTPPQ